MNITLNEEETIVTIIDRFKDVDPSWILGVDADYCGLDRQRYAGGSALWLYRGIPALLNNLLKRNWTVTLETKEAQIVKTTKSSMGGSYGDLEFQKLITLTPHETSIIRWHGDILVVEKNRDVYIIPYNDLKLFEAKPTSGLQSLEKYCPAKLVMIKTENPEIIGVEITCKDTRYLDGLVNDYTGARQYRPAPTVIADKSIPVSKDEWDLRKVLGHYVVNTEAELESYLWFSGFTPSSFGDRQINDAIEELKNGESILVNCHSNSFNFEVLSSINLDAYKPVKEQTQ